MPKYRNYAELSAAFKSGELDPEKYHIMLDKGGTENSFCHRYNPALSDEENDQESEKADAIFQTPDDEIEKLFEALGIPFRWC